MNETTPNPKPAVKRDAGIGSIGAALGAVLTYFVAGGQLPQTDCAQVEDKMWTEIRELREKVLEISYEIKLLSQGKES